MAAVRVPTVVMRGGLTWPIFAVATERLAAMLADARLKVLPDAADHALEPRSTAAVIREASA